MFPSASSSGGVDRPPHPSRGSAHPYLDSVGPTVGPQLFPSFPTRHSYDVDDGESGGGQPAADLGDTAAVFGEEDRMLLRLLYHQQQAIQVQLNTMTEWMQQVNYRIAAVERLVRVSRGTVHTAAPRSYTAQPASRSTSAVEQHYAATSAAQPPLDTSPELAPVDGPRGHPSAVGSVYSGQSQPAVSSVLEGSQACTPPSEQTRHHHHDGNGGAGVGGSSAVPSTSRSFESALAAPWDPHNTSHQSTGNAAHSRTSSTHTSALGRRANPLLNASATKSRLPQSGGAAPRSSLADPRQPQHSRLDTSGLSNAGPSSSSASVSAAATAADNAVGGGAAAAPRQPPVVSPPTATAPPYSTAALEAAVPPYRRIPADVQPATRQPLSRAAAVMRHAPPSNTLTDAAEGRSGREATLPPPPRSAGTSSLHEEPTRPLTSAGEERMRGGGTATHAAASAPPAPPPPFTTTHADPAAAGERASGRRNVDRNRRSVEDDDLSDGYGSYESRMYMKNLGLL